ncbi:hypothetical protein OH764_32865 (plasmid) [Burkholderia sp. M6-3]
MSADASYAFEITLQLRPSLQARAAALRKQYEALQAAFSRQHLPPMSANFARRIELLVRSAGNAGQ